VLVDNSNASGAKTTTIKDLVNTADNKYSFSNFVAAPGDRYQIRFMGTSAQNTGIVTQSENFNVTKSGTAASTTSAGAPSPTGSSEPAASTTPAKGSGANALVAGAGLAGSALVALLML
jgi:hypothetical protein